MNCCPIGTGIGNRGKAPVPGEACSVLHPTPQHGVRQAWLRKQLHPFKFSLKDPELTQHPAPSLAWLLPVSEPKAPHVLLILFF